MGGRSHQDDGTFPVTKSDGEWRAALTEKQYSVLREHGTEFPGTSPLLAEHREGTFVCAGCGQILFDSATKFESGSGWPSFWSAVDGALGTAEDANAGHAPHGDLLRTMRRASRPRVPGRPEADRAALLHERRGAEVRANVARGRA